MYVRPTADLIDLFGPELESCEMQLRSFGRRRLCGAIRTVRCLEDNALVAMALAEPGAGEVLVVEGEGSLRTALLGDRLAARGMANGWAGVVIHGAIRDSVAVDRLDFSVKALGTNPARSSKKGLGERDVPVSFGGVTFTPGHWLYSDEDGIVVASRRLPGATL